MSLEEYFCEGPKIRVPPCSLPPLAGAHVGLAAVVIGFYDLGIEVVPFLPPTSFAGNGRRVSVIERRENEKECQKKRLINVYVRAFN